MKLDASRPAHYSARQVANEMTRLAEATVNVRGNTRRHSEETPLPLIWKLGKRQLAGGKSLSANPRESLPLADASRDLISAAEARRLAKAWKRYLQSGASEPFHAEFRCKTSSDIDTTFLTIGCIISRDRAGNATQAMGFQMLSPGNAGCEGVNVARERELAQAAIVERQRLAALMHDTIGQTLTSLQVAGRCLSEDPAHSQVVRKQGQKIYELARVGHRRMRAIARGLAPEVCSSGDIASHLRSLVKACSVGLAVSCRYEGPETHHLQTEEMALHLYLIAQEAILNAVRHGQAKQVRVRLKLQLKTAELAVRDNGKGFRPDLLGAATEGSGLRNMRSRAAACQGTFDVQSGPNGTVIRCKIPRNAVAGR